MINKERLLNIPDLNAGRIRNMNDVQFASFAQSLNELVDKFPAQADNLRNAMDGKSYSMIAKLLMDIHETLNQIYAEDIAKSCRSQISVLSMGTGTIDHDDVEAFIENFIQNVSSLSVNIQMATANRVVKQAPAYVKKTSGGRPVILAVDNAVMFLNTLEKLLSSYPYDLHCTTSCAKALDFVRSKNPDIILLDIEMPEMNGYELARRIRQSGNNAPIVFITANSEREYVDRAIQEGAEGLLMKPVRINQLLMKIQELI